MPFDYNQFPLPHSAKVLEALIDTMGQESRHMAGRLATHLTSNFAPNETYFGVKSTFRFPSKGWVIVLNRLFYYVTLTSNTIEDLTSEYLHLPVPKGTRIVLVSAEVLPADEADGVGVQNYL